MAMTTIEERHAWGLSCLRRSDGLALRCVRRVARATLVALSTAVLAGAWAVPLSAQTCPCSPPSIDKAVAQASVIFVGKVIAMTSSQLGGSAGSTASIVHNITMQVETTLKGRLDNLVTVLMPDVCGYPLRAGGSFLVFAARNPSGLWTDACKGNASGQAIPSRVAEVRRVLAGPGAKSGSK
jgi:hypothetical protein